jgi:group I intron endonuclease
MAYIYKVTNLINRKIYIGKSLREQQDYFGSGLQITAAIKKYGKENFIKEILEECSEDVLDSREIFWIEHLNSRDTDIGYNISVGGTGGNHYWSSLDEEGKEGLREKISKSRSGQKTAYSEERRKNVRTGLTKWWDEHRNDTEWLKSRRAAYVKNYLIIKDKEITRIKGLKEFCKKNNLDIGWLTQIATGKKFRNHKGYYCIIDNNQTNEQIYLEIEQIKEKDKIVKQNWLEKTQNRPKYICKHCGISVTKSNLVRWHNENCKEWQQQN